jgi:hypothetical protein
MFVVRNQHRQNSRRRVVNNGVEVGFLVGEELLQLGDQVELGVPLADGIDGLNDGRFF